MFAGLVVEVGGPLELDSWAAMIVVVAAMVCSSATILLLSPTRLGRSIAAEMIGICLDA